MRSTVLTSIFLIAFLHSFSQVNVYLENDPVWYIETYNYPSGSDCSGTSDHFNYYVNGDTVINANSYKKIYKKGVLWLSSMGCLLYNPTPYTNSSPSFFVRSSGKKMFHVGNGSDTTEHLLYDFNLSLGDTLPVTFTNPSSNGNVIVTDIDTITTAFGPRQRFELNGPSGNQYLYEGIGATGGFIEDIFPMYLSGSHELLCFSLNDVRYVPSPGSTCDITTGISAYPDQGTLQVFPNPFQLQTTISLNHTADNAQFILYNGKGEKVKTLEFSGNKVMVTRDALKAGLYYYQITEGSGTVSAGKLMLND
jgi:hypothetical protein